MTKDWSCTLTSPLKHYVGKKSKKISVDHVYMKIKNEVSAYKQF